MTDETPAPSGRAQRYLAVALRAAAAVALLGLVIGWVGPARIAGQLRGVSIAWFSAAFVSAIAANLLSAWRWGLIVRALGVRATFGQLASAYAQGIAVNTVLPGATLGGDALRALRLAQGGGDGLAAGASVILDRASGLWVLCALSLLAAAVLLGLRPQTSALPSALSLPVVASLALLLLALLSLPFVIAPGVAPAREGPRRRLHEVRVLLHARRSAMLRSLLPSAGVQLMSAATLWLCAHAAGADIGPLPVLAVAAPVFLAAAIPMSIGGFGPREAVAVVAFPWVGAAPEAGVAAALLYGLAAALQGALGAPLLALSGRGTKAKLRGTAP